jgi:RNA-splicing ligase RtcB
VFDTSKIRKLDEYRFLIPKEARSDMRTNAVIYANDRLMAQIAKDLSLEQAMNVATLPGIVGDSLAMPDIHQGYGFPIGGVAATDYNTGVVSPGGVGFDINCGVRLLASPLTRAEAEPRIRDLINQIFHDVPCGTGKESQLSMASASRPTWNFAKRKVECRELIQSRSASAPRSAAVHRPAVSAAAITFWKCSTCRKFLTA